nr:LeoA/HP0731 family dynamin-like GTPase [Dulcicalothrix desertica]
MGAPDGKTDEEIAQSVISESDVICYVVTNDSIQESEFKFLRLLKENAKPLIILLNVHKNFRDSRRGSYELDKFINNPDKLFALDGSSGNGGHIERIRRYARQHYGNDYFEIVPVMLLAAQLSCEPEHQHHKDELFNASRMQKFYEGIRLSLIEYGAIRRSQTLLGSTAIDIEAPCELLKKQYIGKKVGVGITKLATKTGSNSAGRVFLRTRHVAGSPLHKGIRTIGKFLGFKFKPWQAANIAKGIGNVAKFLGLLLSVGMLAVDIYAKEEEEQQYKKLSDARRDITSQFIALGKDLEGQTEMQLKEVELQVYGEIEKQITEARHNEEEAITSSNQWIGKLAALRKEFEKIICEINNSSDDEESYEMS